MSIRKRKTDRRKLYCKYGHALTSENRNCDGDCKECSNRRARLYYRDNIEKIKEHNKLRYLKNRQDRLDYELKKRYGIDFETKKAMLAAQGGCCVGCSTTDPGKNDWHVDHRHSDGKLRGILCNRCNFALGYVKDSIDTLKNLIEYLDRDRTLVVQVL